MHTCVRKSGWCMCVCARAFAYTMRGCMRMRVCRRACMRAFMSRGGRVSCFHVGSPGFFVSRLSLSLSFFLAAPFFSFSLPPFPPHVTSRALSYSRSFLLRSLSQKAGKERGRLSDRIAVFHSRRARGDCESKSPSRRHHTQSNEIIRGNRTESLRRVRSRELRAVLERLRHISFNGNFFLPLSLPLSVTRGKNDKF